MQMEDKLLQQALESVKVQVVYLEAVELVLVSAKQMLMVDKHQQQA